MADKMVGFHKAECSLCQRETWHYKAAGPSSVATCTNHSAWNPNRKHAVVGTVMQAQLSRTVQAPTERELRVANRLDMTLWRNAEERLSHVVISDEAWAAGLFPDPEPIAKDPDKLYCSFCGVPVDKVLTLSEKKPVIRKVLDVYTTDAGEVVAHERVTSKAETVHACPNCCLNIRKPVVVRRV